MIYSEFENRNIFESVQFLNESELEILNEGFVINSFLNKVKEIKRAKPNEFSESPEIKEFVDKYYDDIMNAANTLEKEPKKLSKHLVGNLCIQAATFVGLAITTAAPAIGMIVFVLGFVSFVIHLSYIVKRSNKYGEGVAEIKKLKSSLEKVKNNSELDDKYKVKIAKLIDKIEEIEIDSGSNE